MTSVVTSITILRGMIWYLTIPVVSWYQKVSSGLQYQYRQKMASRYYDSIEVSPIATLVFDATNILFLPAITGVIQYPIN